LGASILGILSIGNLKIGRRITGRHEAFLHGSGPWSNLLDEASVRSTSRVDGAQLFNDLSRAVQPAHRYLGWTFA